MNESEALSALEAGPSEGPAKRTRTPSTRLADSEVTPQLSKKGTGQKFGSGHGSAGGNAPHKRQGSSCKANGTPPLEQYPLRDKAVVDLKKYQAQARQVASRKNVPRVSEVLAVCVLFVSQMYVSG